MNLSTLVQCEQPIGKLLRYPYLPVRQVFFLSTLQEHIAEALGSYRRARNSLLPKYGISEDGENYTILIDNVSAYRNELAELDEQEVEISFPEDKITLCIESIEKAEKDLLPDKRLGFSADDWAAIQQIIKVVESEE